MNVEVELSSLHTVKVSFESKTILSSHKGTLQEGLTMTMTKVCSQYWIPTVRNLVKFIIRKCHASKKY